MSISTLKSITPLELKQAKLILFKLYYIFAKINTAKLVNSITTKIYHNYITS